MYERFNRAGRSLVFARDRDKRRGSRVHRRFAPGNERGSRVLLSAPLCRSLARYLECNARGVIRESVRFSAALSVAFSRV